MKRFLCWLGCLIAAGAMPADAPPFELKDGDRVVFLGDTLIEREQHYGWIELMLTMRFPDRNITFRNLGWSADTPAGDSRFGLSLLQAGLEPADEGWKQLQKQLTEAKPTVVILGYGMASSFAGEAGLPKFKADYERLLDTIAKISPGVRFVMLSPIRHEALPDSSPHNAQLAQYSEAIKQIADQRKAPFVNLFSPAVAPKASGVRTDNGIHLNNQGYHLTALILANALFGDYGSGLDSPLAEALRQLILRKNEFFFYRSRPANMAYIFGFRRGEQGRNAVEMPQFDPMIAAEETKIRELSRHLTDANFKPGSELQPATLRNESAAAKFAPQKTPEFIVGPGLEISLWAEDPQLKKPIQINFDPQGRLWVASSEVYPHIEPGQAPTDRIIVLADTNGSGHANQATVFAEGLLIPTGVAPGNGGCYVAQSTELLHFADTNGDGKADQRRVVLSGFGTEDTHHNLHTLRWGPDGRLWMNQSIYTRTDTETPHGVMRHKSGAVMALRPDTLDFEVIFKGWCNPWGHVFDEYGQSFVTDGAGGKGVSWGLPGAMYFTYARIRREMDSISPGNYPKFASLEIIRSEVFPPDWQGSFITCDFRANRVTRFSVTEQGAGYVTKQEPDLLRTTASTFRPIDVTMGPDGALYIADWSNPIIQHGEVDFRDPRRDRTHGRIWRVAWKGVKTAATKDFTKLDNAQLFAELTSANSYNANQARRVLLERGPSAVLPEVKSWLARQTDDRAKLAGASLCAALGQPEPKLIGELAASADPGIRVAAVRMLASEGSNSIALAKLVQDAHPRVRAEATRALAKIPSAESAALILGVVDTLKTGPDGRPTDPFLDYAVWLSINDLAQPFLAALESGAWVPDTAAKQKQLEFALKSLEPSLSSSFLAKRLAREPLARDGSGPWIELVGQAGGPAELEKLFAQAVSGGFDDAATTRALAALNTATRLRNVRPTGSPARLTALLDQADADTQRGAARLAGAWKLRGPATTKLVAFASDANTRVNLRDVCFESLRETGGGEVITALTPLAQSSPNAAVRAKAAATLFALQPDQFAGTAATALAAAPSEAEAAALWNELLKGKNAGKALAPAVMKTTLPPAAVKTGLRAAREGGRKEDELIAALTLSAGAATPDASITPESIKALAAAAQAQGDAARGERVYRRVELGCVTCHSIGGAGGKVGPDMTSIGASAPIDYLVESLFLPNAKIKEGFHSLLVETRDDQEMSGILVRETPQELVLRNSANLEVSIPKNNIRNRKNGLSLMPSGLLDALPESERLDLFKFLSQLGKPGDFDAGKGGVARLWKVTPALHTDLQSGSERFERGQFPADRTASVYSLVNGRLMAADLEANAKAGFWTSLVAVYGATQFTAPKAGPATLQLEGGGKIEAWIDGQPAKLAPDGTLAANLAAGPHTLVMRFDAKALPPFARVRSTEVDFVN